MYLTTHFSNDLTNTAVAVFAESVTFRVVLAHEQIVIITSLEQVPQIAHSAELQERSPLHLDTISDLIRPTAN